MVPMKCNIKLKWILSGPFPFIHRKSNFNGNDFIDNGSEKSYSLNAVKSGCPKKSIKFMQPMIRKCSFIDLHKKV